MTPGYIRGRPSLGVSLPLGALPRRHRRNIKQENFLVVMARALYVGKVSYKLTKLYSINKQLCQKDRDLASVWAK